MTSRELALGVVGLGFGANHARVLGDMDGVRLAAVCDADEARLATIASGASAYADIEAMLCGARLDAVVVAVPAGLHEAMALACIRQGCAVLVEKPLAPSLAEGRRIVAAAESADVPLMTGHIERFNPALQELARRVRAGEAGRVLQFSARRAGAIRVPPADVNVVHDSALHDIDAMRFVLGAEVEEVYAGAQSGIVTPNENAIVGQMRFDAVDGIAAIGAIEVNWLSPRRVRELTVLGERGLFVLDYAAQTLDFYATPATRTGPVQGWDASRSAGAPEGMRIAVEPREQLVQELSAFAEALRSHGAMPVSARDALAALAVADALTESTRIGRPVKPEAV
ncbi:MAG TPA: Gfo/Idh/MocA family oxidoreductase [Dehalococcoidia bacterium]